MTLSTGQTLGVFEILGAIGAGGMGEVYKARDTPVDLRTELDGRATVISTLCLS